ncbi:hypothetical protein MNEG_1881 [Monoraphidium neglectum]|uniref:Uncharacterized protein n=1 Tax=Monoraphidium neglectum TaxID=145388 RepID=A0A0D2N0K5_9CHLO|nr:hypothetical protein MNEG_1881 [Monoraphidium neglectum]KIZ06072.1 hypothetical protein MNEG_1881 [Monoraphidium neglectum]|eukprot:XP_013905091.1 hypothetical protein MNEG_1881 [Monoraphidium neglectum]
MRGVNAVATRTARPSGVHVGIARLSVAHRTFLGCAAQGAPPAPDASKQPARPTPPQHAPLPKAGLPVRQARAESPARDTRRDVLIPISGPPSDAPPELRRMQHPADAADVAPTSIVEVATPQQLAIGKREAREQAVALA